MTTTRYALQMGRANRHSPLMVFDWTRAAKIINEQGAQNASAGLYEDWNETEGVIWENGKPVLNSSAYLASTWAVPNIFVCGQFIECYRMQNETPGWGCYTSWPDEALSLL